MKIKTKQITVTAIMLAICLVSQFFKNLSVYITGPIINAALILDRKSTRLNSSHSTSSRMPSSA